MNFNGESGVDGHAELGKQEKATPQRTDTLKCMMRLSAHGREKATWEKDSSSRRKTVKGNGCVPTYN